MVEPRLTVMRWVKARIDELVEEEMDSGTQVEQDDFKAAVEQFAIRFNTVQTELDSAIKDKQLQAAELFEVAKLQSAMVFGLDDEPIASIEATPGLIMGSGPSIALNPTTQKRKRDEAGSSGPSKDAILLLETFERSTTILAQALVRAEGASSLPALTAPVPIPASTGSTGISRVADSLALDKKMSDMEDCIEERMKTQWNDMQSKLDQILAAINVLGGQESNNN